jgi:hypothetical protein
VSRIKLFRQRDGNRLVVVVPDEVSASEIRKMYDAVLEFRDSPDGILIVSGELQDFEFDGVELRRPPLRGATDAYPGAAEA